MADMTVVSRSYPGHDGGTSFTLWTHSSTMAAEENAHPCIWNNLSFHRTISVAMSYCLIKAKTSPFIRMDRLHLGRPSFGVLRQMFSIQKTQGAMCPMFCHSGAILKNNLELTPSFCCFRIAEHTTLCIVFLNMAKEGT